MSKTWFRRGVIAVFIFQGVLGLGAVLGFTLSNRALQVNRIEAAASVVSLLLIWVGILKLLRSGQDGFVWFQRSIVVNILITQPFMFYENQFAAVGGLMIQLLLYGAVRYMRVFQREQAERSTAQAQS